MAFKEKTKKLMAYLVSCPDKVLDSNPQFSQLLTKLTEKLALNGTSLHTQRHLEMVQQKISQAKHTWLMNSIIFSELSELLADLEIRCQEGTLSVDDKQLKDVLSKALAYSEVADKLNILPSGGTTSGLFGLSPEVVDRYNPVKHNLSDLQQSVLPKLEDQLRKKCEELYNFYDPNHESVSDHLLIAKSQSLPALVERKKQDLVQEMELLKQDRSLRERQFWLYYQKILESLSVMETLIADFKLTKQTEMDNVAVKFLQTKSEALCMKMRVLQLQIVCDTYTQETVRALSKIRGHLDHSIAETERELASTIQSIEAYLDLGTEFRLLMEQNRHLQQEIENRKWALQQLSH